MNTPAMDDKGLAAATAAVSAEIDRYWSDDSVEPGHEPVARAAIAAYLAVTARNGDGADTIGLVDEIKALVVASYKDRRLAKSNLNAAAHKLNALRSSLQAAPAEQVAPIPLLRSGYAGPAVDRLHEPAKASQEAEVVKGKAWRDIATQAEHVALGIASGAPTVEATRVLIELIRSTWRDAQPSPEADGAR